MYRVKMEVYLDIDGTNAEVVDTVRDFEMRNLVEFDFLDILFDEPMVRPLRDQTFSSKSSAAWKKILNNKGARLSPW